MKLQAVRGFKDWLPEDFRRYHYLCEVSRKILSLYGFEEVKIPTLEKTELYVRSIGEVTDIVQKETYTFIDRNGESLTLRPEATAGICRMVVEKSVYAKQKPIRFFTIGPMFRHERPQKGRLREFYQVSVEYFGDITPFVEAELINLSMHILKEPEKEFGSFFYPLRLEINSLGCLECRPSYREYLVSALREKKDELCKTCQERLERNPLRVLDCKEDACKRAVSGLKTLNEFWCSACKEHFTKLSGLLSSLGLKFLHNPYLVRGLDYYVRTIFEIKAEGLSAQDTVCAGGRYDYLVEELGGPKLPGIGFAIGVERWGLVVFGEDRAVPETQALVFIAPLGEQANAVALRLSYELRARGIKTVASYEDKSLKAKLRSADKLGVEYVLILGEDELSQNKVCLRDMKKGTQELFSLYDIATLVDRIKNRTE
ncbi:MAG: histidine--tRNA ligase [Thermodesulfobacterium sp.]|nr:histidine--tRNA ligase [Thermodesulfobacterium sp.]